MTDKIGIRISLFISSFHFLIVMPEQMSDWSKCLEEGVNNYNERVYPISTIRTIGGCLFRRTQSLTIVQYKCLDDQLVGSENTVIF